MRAFKQTVFPHSQILTEHSILEFELLKVQTDKFDQVYKQNLKDECRIYKFYCVEFINYFNVYEGFSKVKPLKLLKT